MARLFILSGLILVAIGICMSLNLRLPFWLGHLPGDLSIKKENFEFYFPITTSLLVSIVLTLIFAFFKK